MSRRPNILWVCTDQQRVDTVGALGCAAARTPTLDRLCAAGTAFRHATCQNPICTPSRASFLSGLHPTTTHANINGNARCNLPEGARLVTARLRDAGYRCGLVGKLHIASAWNGVEERIDDGYETFDYSHSPTVGFDGGNAYLDWLRTLGRLEEAIDHRGYDPALRRGAHYRDDLPPELHQTSWCFDRAIDFVTRDDPRPWALSLNCFDPHPPYDAPRSVVAEIDPAAIALPEVSDAELAEQAALADQVWQAPPGRPDPGLRDRIATYHAMVALIDRNLARLLEALERSGQREDTLVVFHSDHGTLLGEHGLEHKGCRFYRELIEVPLIVSWPGVVRAGAVSDALVELTDLAPTLCDAAGCDPGWTHGSSLLPLLRGETDLHHHRDHVRCEFLDTLDMDHGKAGRGPHRPCHATCYRDRRHKLCVYHRSEHGELYDLERDPAERCNLWDDPASRDRKHALLKAGFDATVRLADPGSQRIGRF